MAVKRRPYDMIYLFTFEFATAVLLFYTAAVLLLMAFGTNDDDLIKNLGSGPSDFLIENARMLSEYLGIAMAAVTGLTMVEVWGLLRRKRWSYKLGAIMALSAVILNFVVLVFFGFGNQQFAIRLVVCMVLPFLSIYYLRQPDIADYLLKR